jgi:hypothetical protein
MTHRDPDPELIAALERIARKAEIMRIDAIGRRQQSVAGDAEEIRLLTEIALRRVRAGS